MKDFSIYQGKNRRTPYFEGWYFKAVSINGGFTATFILGVSYEKNGQAHSFIQYIDGKTGFTAYVKFSIEAFSFNKDFFQIQIGSNTFSLDGFSINLPDHKISAEVKFSNPMVWKKSLLAPSAMGWFSFFRNLECNHHVVSFSHQLNGWLKASGKVLELDGGVGYVEKDWGRSFPTSWIWMQTNNFEKKQSVLHGFYSYDTPVAKIVSGIYHFARN